MQTPRYFFSNDFVEFQDYFLSRPHVRKTFRKGEILWEPGIPFRKTWYIVSGIIQNYILHENGHKKITSFHGSGSVWPVFNRIDYKIENSISLLAMTDVEALEMTKTDFYQMFEENSALRGAVIDIYSNHVNLLLFESAHQEYNNTFIKLCNLLYLLRNPDLSSNFAAITQDEMADTLGISRVHLTKALTKLRNEGIIRTTRKHIEILDLPALARYCSLEAV